MDGWDTLTRSVRERDRLAILTRVQERRLTQAVAAERLDVSRRHVEPLCRALRTAGPPGLVLRRRGRPSNRQLAASGQAQVVALVRAHYADVGPTLALEKLVALHDVTISVETLRTWMRARACGCRGRSGPDGRLNPGTGGSVAGSSSRSTAAIMRGSRTAGRAAPCLSTSTTPPAS